MKGLSELLSTVGGKQTPKGSEYIVHCWVCDQDKIYFNTDKAVGWCVKCERTVRVQDIARHLAGIPLQSIEQFLADFRAEERHRVGFRDSVIEALLGGGQLEKQLKEVNFPDEYRSLRDGRNSVVGKKAIKYLEGRGFDIEMLMRMEFGYCATGRYANRIIVPTFEEGRLVYWQARDFTGTADPKKKILNPPMDDFPNGKSEVIFNYDGVETLPLVVITESWGSALGVGAQAVGINGQRLSARQLSKLVQLDASIFVVLLDPGAERFTWEIAEQLSAYKTTLLSFLTTGDPNEVTKKVLNESFRNAITYSKEAHIRYCLEHNVVVRRKRATNL